jgi:uncharacterized protein
MKEDWHLFRGLERQQIEAPEPFSGAGLWFVPVVHEGNQTYSLEEVSRVAALVDFLIRDGVEWTDCEGKKKTLSLDEVLIVAP